VSTRRANHEGNIRRRADGSWEARMTHVDPDSGQTRRVSFYGPTAKAVRKKMNDARDRIKCGAPVRDATRTVADWLAQWQSTTLAVSDRKESTRELYAMLSRKHLEPPPFGAITLDRLRPTDVEALILKLKGAGLADSTVRSVYTVLRAALDGAVRDRLLAHNAAAVVKRPGIERVEARHVDELDATALLRAAEGLRYRPVLVLIAATGLRRGEALALRWEHVNFDDKTLRVEATLGRVGGQLVSSVPKTKRSRRTVPISPAIVTLLKAQKAQQAAERLHAGDQWTDSGLVFTTEFGTPVDPRNILRTVQTAAAKAGIGRVGVHTLRHSAAVGWLESGVHIKAVADLLGHSSIAVTGDVYGHTSDQAARAAIEGRSGALGL